jgi:hypothetical protein
VRTLLCLSLVVAAACAREKPQAAVNAATRYAGDWAGRSVQSASDTGVPFASHMTAGPDGTLSGTVAFTGSDTAAVALRVVEASDSAIVFEIGPYHNPAANADAITRFEGRLAGDSLWGSYVTLPTVGGGVVPDMSTAQWKNAEMHPAPGSEPVRGTFAAARKRAAP